jgi:hypothetical protein
MLTDMIGQGSSGCFSITSRDAEDPSAGFEDVRALARDQRERG